MRIGVVSATVFPCPPPGYSGLEMIAWQCARGLAERGHEVSLIAPDGSHCPGCKVVSTGPAGLDEKMAFGRYVHALDEHDVIIDHSWQKWSVIQRARGELRAPVLQVMHAPINTMMSTPPPLEKPCFVCISRDQAEHLKALFNLTARVAYNGIDLDFYRPIPNVRRTKRFLFLGRFSTIKGADLAIRACKEVGVGLDLIGDTTITNEPDYLKQCQEMADGKQIRIVGGQCRDNCVWWYSQAHAFIHANQRFREPFGLAPVEAMACGLPVIAWDYGAMRETISAGETGLLVNTFEDLVSSVETLQNLNDEEGPTIAERERCRRWASQFSVQAMAGGYEALCKEAMQTGGW